MLLSFPSHSPWRILPSCGTGSLTGCEMENMKSHFSRECCCSDTSSGQAKQKRSESPRWVATKFSRVRATRAVTNTVHGRLKVKLFKVLNFSWKIYANLCNDAPLFFVQLGRKTRRLLSEGSGRKTNRDYVKFNFNGYKWTADGEIINYTHYI